ncbi:hypothetical protein N4Q63_06885 [Leclercia adecarboxylata]|uniref:Uncharacterized protein n=1 Tax=Leclercia adecarboxylata TaxID=83655 RepID=A0A9X4BD02_9ENTR|nr:hypothetical protein [Leclercia adecarboxylata]MBD1405654.1 hypothetical protein [Leclercia adecarboxylata]MDC6621620.1 hypothetical protein [Leclercia adecarboxylata]MDC6632612.1 hypothetical protein [Leclercia adecarboxylata]MDC6637988.1 hypothetical protein [Leclercia adecarboxylata]MDC6649807.1 hypothetical protein [Leclercia adecarboxylata]
MSLLANGHIQSYVSAEGKGIQKASGNIKQPLPVFHSHARTHPCEAGVNISQMQIGIPEAEFQTLAVIRLQEDIRDGLHASAFQLVNKCKLPLFAQSRQSDLIVFYP